MPIVQVRNSSMAQILDSAKLPIRERQISFECYDNTGGQTFTSSVTINLDTESLNSSADAFSLAGNGVTLAFSGVYEVHFHVTVGHSTGSSDAVALAYLQVDSGGGFATLVASLTYIPIHGTSYGSGQVTIKRGFSADDILRLRVARDIGGDTLLLPVQGARLSVTAMYLTDNPT